MYKINMEMKLSELATTTDTFFGGGRKRYQFGINDTYCIDTTRVAAAAYLVSGTKIDTNCHFLLKTRK
jgi:hypothetical protein